MKISPFSWPSFATLFGFVAATLSTGAIGGFATSSSVRSWYPGLIKPSWNPPAWVFGPVWTTLFILMAVAAWRISRLPLTTPGRRAVLVAFFVQLALNALWSVLFFGLRSPTVAAVEIVLLWTLITWLQLRLLCLDRTAAWLWAPYVLWVSFATVLNVAIAVLNT
jgi:translocator protein